MMIEWSLRPGGDARSVRLALDENPLENSNIVFTLVLEKGEHQIRLSRKAAMQLSNALRIVAETP